MSKKKKMILILITVFVISTFIINYFMFARVTIKTDMAPYTASLDGEETQIPFSGYLRTGYHTFEFQRDGFVKIEENISVKPGSNVFLFNIKTYKEAFIETLPQKQPEFEIEYNKQQDFFYVLIKKEPTIDARKKALELMGRSQISTNDEKIVWDYVSGIEGRVGP